MHCEDDALVVACQSGDVAAFEALVHRYQDRTLRLLYLLLGNAEDAEDVAQETFLRVYRCIRTFERRSSFSTWLHRIAFNTARNWIRDNRRETQTLIPLDFRSDDYRNTDEVLIARERKREIRDALATLPLHYREAIILRHFDELSYQEIADVQQVPIGTVRSRIAKGRELLEKELRHSAPAQNKERMTDCGLQKGEEVDPTRSGHRTQ